MCDLTTKIDRRATYDNQSFEKSSSQEEELFKRADKHLSLDNNHYVLNFSTLKYFSSSEIKQIQS